MLKCLVSAALGLLLMVAPGALDYGDPAASFHYILGPLIVSFSVIAVWEAVRGARFFNVPLVAALIVVTPILSQQAEPIAVALITGAGSGLLSLAPNPTGGRYGGGWRSLVTEDQDLGRER